MYFFDYLFLLRHSSCNWWACKIIHSLRLSLTVSSVYTKSKKTFGLLRHKVSKIWLWGQTRGRWMDGFCDPPTRRKEVSWNILKTCSCQLKRTKVLQQNQCVWRPEGFSSLLKWLFKPWKKWIKYSFACYSLLFNVMYSILASRVTATFGPQAVVCQYLVYSALWFCKTYGDFLIFIKHHFMGFAKTEATLAAMHRRLNPAVFLLLSWQCRVI